MKRYLAYDRLSSYSPKEVSKLCTFTFNYCIDKFEANPRKINTLVYCLEHLDKDEYVYGYYDCADNEIVLNLNRCRTIKELITTFIHEYIHSTQNCSTYYGKLYKKYGYDKHPYEVEARYYENYFKDLLKLYRRTL